MLSRTIAFLVAADADARLPQKWQRWMAADKARLEGALSAFRDCSVEAVRLAGTAVTVPPSASAVADGGELLGQAAAEGRDECEEA